MEDIERNFPWLEAGIGLGVGVLGTVMVSKLLVPGIARAAGLTMPSLLPGGAMPKGPAPRVGKGTSLKGGGGRDSVAPPPVTPAWAQECATKFAALDDRQKGYARIYFRSHIEAYDRWMSEGGTLLQFLATVANDATVRPEYVGGFCWAVDTLTDANLFNALPPGDKNRVLDDIVWTDVPTNNRDPDPGAWRPLTQDHRSRILGNRVLMEMILFFNYYRDGNILFGWRRSVDRHQAIRSAHAAASARRSTLQPRSTTQPRSEPAPLQDWAGGCASDFAHLPMVAAEWVVDQYTGGAQRFDGFMAIMRRFGIADESMLADALRSGSRPFQQATEFCRLVQSAVQRWAPERRPTKGGAISPGAMIDAASFDPLCRD